MLVKLSQLLLLFRVRASRKLMHFKLLLSPACLLLTYLFCGDILRSIKKLMINLSGHGRGSVGVRRARSKRADGPKHGPKKRHEMVSDIKLLRAQSVLSTLCDL